MCRCDRRREAVEDTLEKLAQKKCGLGENVDLAL